MPKPYFNTQSQQIQEMIRVDQAGEYAAKIIYQTQVNNTKDQVNKKILQNMLEQEQEHLNFFNAQMQQRKIRPTALAPLWHALSWGLGKISAKLGSKYTMLATDAVEDVIQKHYAEQIDALEDSTEMQLKEKIAKFRQDEIHHQDVATSQIEKLNSLDVIFEKIIKFGCQLAINISKKI